MLDRGGPHVDAAEAPAEVHRDAQESHAGHALCLAFFPVGFLAGALAATGFAERAARAGAPALRGTKRTSAPRASPSAAAALPRASATSMRS
jgi:hypothetical protein